MIPTTILYHPKERKSKCSLRSLFHYPSLTFLKARHTFQFDATHYLLLTINAPVLTPADVSHPLLLLDSTWRLLPQLEKCITGEPIRRSLPPVATAYPRKSKIVQDPTRGLASVEALYLAVKILGEPDPRILAHYPFREAFLTNVARAEMQI